MRREGCRCTWVVELGSSFVKSLGSRLFWVPSLSSFQCQEGVITNTAPSPQSRLPARPLYEHQAENSRENAIWKCSTQSERPAAHLDHELFVNTDNQWAKDCIDHMARIDMCSTCQLFTTECIKARRFLINPSKPSCYDPLDNTH